ncbi:MAG: type III-B CRISPR module RAMP protein Cmr1 [Desulfobulbaceae bacterium DB1]|nr:MAG: type III-B CRISPR module RAMP protein Cmr1 [Desulfobulbaceae bacterium DB1]
MSRTLSIEIETLTPLWTAGANSRKMDRLHETGIIGSLRWWYEAMIRGLGGNVKNHESGGCQFDADAYAKHPELPKRARLKKAGLCDVCQLFGATGWKRRFNMEIGQGEKLFEAAEKDKILLPSGRVHPGKKGPRAGGWFLMPDSVTGKNIPLTFRFTDPEDAEKMKILLSLIERHGTLGAKKASGNGVVRFRLKNNGSLAPSPVSTVFPWATSARV